MISLIQYIQEELRVNKHFYDNVFVPKNRIELGAEIMRRYNDCDVSNNPYLNASDIDILNVDDLTGMFSNLDNVEVIDVTGWDTSHVKCMHQMFYNCKKLKDIIGIEDFDFSSATNITHMFAFCKKLRISKRIKNWRIDRKQTNTSCMLYNCPTRTPQSIVVV